MATMDETFAGVEIKSEEVPEEMLAEIEENITAGRAPGGTKWPSEMLILWLIAKVRRLRGVLRDVEDREDRARGLT